MATALISSLRTLNQIGLIDIIIPFILIFTIVYAILQKSKIFGSPEKASRFNLILSLSLSLIVVVPHVIGRYPSGYDPIEIMKLALPNISAILLAIFLMFMVIGLWGVSGNWSGSGSGVVALIIVAIVSYLFLRAGNLISKFPAWLNWMDSQTESLIIVILTFGLVVWLIIRPKSKTSWKDKLKGPSTIFGGNTNLNKGVKK